mmetsp:Transcript_13377/g.31854  ORF Transcript_13377/g.31854 Transcript_13377/m.31854 type:complete len:325 (+) Transcript_13377:366-1340(+)
MLRRFPNQSRGAYTSQFCIAVVRGMLTRLHGLSVQVEFFPTDGRPSSIPAHEDRPHSLVDAAVVPRAHLVGPRPAVAQQAPIAHRAGRVDARRVPAVLAPVLEPLRVEQIPQLARLDLRRVERRDLVALLLQRRHLLLVQLEADSAALQLRNRRRFGRGLQVLADQLVPRAPRHAHARERRALERRAPHVHRRVRAQHVRVRDGAGLVRREEARQPAAREQQLAPALGERAVDRHRGARGERLVPRVHPARVEEHVRLRVQHALRRHLLHARVVDVVPLGLLGLGVAADVRRVVTRRERGAVVRHHSAQVVLRRGLDALGAVRL